MNYKATTISLINCHSWYHLILALMLISLSGCTTFRPDRWYLHNPAHKDLADQAKANWTPVKDNLWQSLLNNQKLTTDTEIQAQRLLQQSVATSHHIEMVNMTWSEISERITKYQTTLEALCQPKEMLATKQCKLIERDSLLISKNTTETEKKTSESIDRQKELEQAKKNIANWKNSLALIEKASHEVLLQQASKSEVSLKELQKQATDIVKKGGIGELIPKEGLVSQPPGITLEILLLGADLEKAQLDRAKATEKRLQEEMALFENREKEIDTAHNWIKQAIGEIDTPKFNHERGNTVLGSIQRSLKTHTLPNTQGLILKLQKCVLAEDLYTLNDNIYEISKQELIHHFEIENSAISVKEREALIQHGLETLAVYHNGGITQEEINAIIQAAQAVALAVISAGVI